MTDSNSSSPIPGIQPDRMFPKLTPSQMERIATQGTLRHFKKGEIIIDAGGQVLFFQ